VAPKGPYSESKRFGEEVLLARAGADFAPVVLRQGTVYGASPRMRFDLVVNTFVKDALLNGRLHLHGGGWMWRPLVDVQDAAESQVVCLEAPEAAVHGQVFNVVQDNYQIRDLALLVAEYVGAARGPVEVTSAPSPAQVRNYRCSNDKLYQTLGFRPGRSVQESVNEMVTAYAGLDAAGLCHPRYYNLDWLILLREAHAVLQPFDYVLRPGEGPRVGE
jgi:nucleoside-diphosphate-sugar epimerase